MKWVREDRLCGRLGVARETLRAVRVDGGEGELWRRGGGNRVEWSEDGVLALEGLLGLEAEACRAAVDWRGPGQVRVRVTRLFRNPRVVEAEPVDAGEVDRELLDGGRMRLCVGSSKRLCVGLVVVAEHRQEDLWEMVSRAPASRVAAARLVGKA